MAAPKRTASITRNRVPKVRVVQVGSRCLQRSAAAGYVVAIWAERHLRQLHLVNRKGPLLAAAHCIDI